MVDFSNIIYLIGDPAAYKVKEAGLYEVTNGKDLIDAIICLASSEQFINDHPDVIDAFNKAQEEISNFMKDNPDETKNIVEKELDIDDKAYNHMYPMYDFSIKISVKDRKGFERSKEFMLENKMIENNFDIEELF